MEKGICHIVGAYSPDMTQFTYKDGDLIIAADGGYGALKELGVKPDVTVGDFDSLGYVPEGERIVRHPVMKDDTDMLLAVKLGLSEGFLTFRIYGGIGGRLDHTLANIQVLGYIANRGGAGVLLGREQNAAVIKNGLISFTAEAEGEVSVFAFGGTARGVNLRGLMYPLTEAVLTSEFPLGVSNRFTGVEASAEIKDGSAVIIWSGNADRTVKEIRRCI